MRLLILGTGNMAASHAEGFGALDGVILAGCVDIDLDRAETFAKKHGIPRAFRSIGEALETGAFDAVTNVTPDGVHFKTTMEVIKAGLPVFCEKPLATNHADAVAMTEAAQDAGLINGVNLTYRNVAALQKARELVADGAIGDLRHFEASYLQSWLTQPAWGDWRTDETWLWRLSTAHGSNGVLGDVGIHIMDFASFASGSDIASCSARLKTFSKAPGDRIGAFVLDANDSAVLTTELESGALGVIHTSRFASGHLNDLRLKLYGDRGGIEVTNDGDLGTLRVSNGPDLQSGTWRDVELEPVVTNYQRFRDAVVSGRPMSPDFAVAAKLQYVIDACFEA